ncbi:ATP-binding protein [Flavobacterium sedimenticola]|uniref:ATP-binding protein n=1 Tax=Flavobacterium sedimenticola TaxID=3043286 RepID=A0ABT6XMP8_9FLAO|nr:ATP-binding protein [Flavobacterium sedimenticola]MDI9256358.1 ATP-binding protein [Flavobacterium sedimenticola]
MGLIKKSNELNIQSKIKGLIYGQPGMGKTTLALSAPKPLLFDFDNGVHRVNFAHLDGVDTVQISSYDDFLTVLETEDLSGYETFVIDTGGKCLDYMSNYIIARNPKMGKANGTLTLQGYGERKAEFSALVKRITMMDKHIVFVAHRDTKTEGDDTRYVPQFGGSSYDSLVTELDLVGYLEANGKERTLTFDPTSRNDGKNTCNLPSLMKLPIIVNEKGEPTAPNNFFNEHIIKAYAKRLEDRKAAGEKYNALIAELDHEICLIHDVDSANDLIGRIDAFEHIGNSKAVAAQKIATKAKELGLVLNKTSMKYELPKTTANAEATA